MTPEHRTALEVFYRGLAAQPPAARQEQLLQSILNTLVSIREALDARDTLPEL